MAWGTHTYAQSLPPFSQPHQTSKLSVSDFILSFSVSKTMWPSVLVLTVLMATLVSPVGTNNISVPDLLNTSDHKVFNTAGMLGRLGSADPSPSALTPIIEFINNMIQSFPLPEGLSSQCRLDLVEFKRGVNSSELWAIQMLDAMGKPQSGVLKGQKTFVGQYDECREVSHETQNGHVIQGQLCTPQVQMNFSSFGEKGELLKMLLEHLYIDVCLPDSCSDEDVFMLFQGPAASLGVNLTAASCIRDKDPSGDARFWIAVLPLVVVVILAILGTAYNILLEKNDKKEEIDSTNDKRLPTEEGKERHHVTEKTALLGTYVNRAFEDKPDQPGNDPLAADVELVCEEANSTKVRGLGSRLLLCFSVLDNGRKLLDCTKGGAELSFLNGLRVISITWVILGHCFIIPTTLKENSLGNIADLAYITRNWTAMVLVSGSLSVDSFFVMSGSLVSYIFLKHAQTNGGITRRGMVLYYLHRLWRLIPLYMIFFVFYIGISPYLMVGPYDNSETQDIQSCKSNWWHNVLFLNNILGDVKCFEWSWYLANDMQFYIIAPLALLPWAYGKKNIGILVCLCLVTIHFVSNIILFHDPNFDATSPSKEELQKYKRSIYYTPWSRVGTFAIGLLLGYELHLTGGNYKMKKMTTALGWLVATGAGLTCVYVMFDTTKNAYKEYHLAWNNNQFGAYDTLSRPVWACAVSWVIFACFSGSGGIVNTFLSWSAWRPLSRLSYGVYLCHMIIIYITFGNRTTPFILTQWSLMETTVYVTTLSFLASFLFTLLVESPIIGLEKVLLPKFI